MRGLTSIACVFALACGGNVQPDGGSPMDGTTDPCAGMADGASCGASSICVGGECVASACPDGFVTPPREECEDGNQIAGDGCENDCTFTCRTDDQCGDSEPCNGRDFCTAAHICSSDPPPAELAACGTGMVCRAGVCSNCGNSTLDAGEECDDGNLDAGDGCENSCTFSCETAADCADGEPCNGDEACNAHVCEPAVVFPVEGAACSSATVPDGICRSFAAGRQCSLCGNGRIDAPETCDDGNFADGDVCSSTCGCASMICGGACTDVTSDPMHCGDCATICPDGANATGACNASACGYDCATSFADCTTADGCETDTRTDPTHCGDCAIVCTVANGTPGCAGSACNIASCSTHFADCGGGYADGCETDLLTDNMHCGSCTTACGSRSACAGGVCMPSVGALSAQDFGGAGSDAGNGIAIARADDVVIVGQYDTAGFRFGSLLPLPAPMGTDAFVVNLGSNAGLPRWAATRAVAGTNYYEDVEADIIGDVFTGGYQVDGVSDAYGDSSTLAWSAYIGEPAGFTATIDDVSVHGSVCVVGTFESRVIVTVRSVSRPSILSRGATDGLAFCYDGSGTILWAPQQLGGAGADTARAVFTTSSTVFVAGTFSGTVTFDRAQTSMGGTDVYVVALDAITGAPVWSYTYGTTGDDYVADCTAVGGRLFCTGIFSGTSTFGGPDPHTSRGSDDGYLVALLLDGTFDWARTWGSTRAERTNSVAFDSDGNVVVAGRVRGVADIDLGGSAPIAGRLPWTGGTDVFAAAYSRSGALRWGWVGGGANDEEAFGVAAGASGTAWLTGYFYDTTMYGTAVLVTTGPADRDAFVLRLEP